MGEQVITVAVARSRIYRLLSATFLYPEEERFSFLIKGVEEARGLLPFLPEDEGQKTQETLEAFAASLRSLSLEALQEEYRRIFGHLISQECPPYEAEYQCSHIFQQAQSLGDIAGFYRAFGLEVSDQAKDRLDHIAVELEFMSFLAYKEAYALAHHGEEAADLCREAQQKFFHEHLGRWAPLFFKLLGRKAQEGFYQQLASFAEGFLDEEQDRLGVEPVKFSEGDLKPVGVEPEGTCFSCGIEDLYSIEPKEEESWRGGWAKPNPVPFGEG
ncbi:MAG: molecular chaperone TorD family protein [candidate division NC10 bacterium]|nr:molecular chaperone TorD family protein [candidate division NC10 bacterium]